MSLRYISRVMYQGGMRVVQGIKEQAPKCDSTIKSFKDSSCGSSSRQARKFSGGIDPTIRAVKTDKLKHSEESLRTVMYLSCWGPN